MRWKGRKEKKNNKKKNKNKSKIRRTRRSVVQR